MDTSRLSIARLLELDVPFSWDEAVAVVQEVAMLSDVHAAMYNRPSLVSAEHCYITRAGAVELPETTDAESPDAVPELLQAMLAGRDAPEALEDLAFGGATRDMSGALAAFPVGNRRAAIAKLAVRALTASAAPPAAALPPSLPAEAPTAVAPPGSAVPGAAPESGMWTESPPGTAPPVTAPRPGPPVDAASHAQEAVALARERFRPVLVQPPARPPFVAEPAPQVVDGASSLASPPYAGGGSAAAAQARSSAPFPAHTATPDAELERIRRRNAARTAARRRWTERFGALVTWRPSFPDPRVLGSAAIVIAAIVSVLWRNGSTPASSPAPAPVAATPLAVPSIVITPPAPQGGPPITITAPAPASAAGGGGGLAVRPAQGVAAPTGGRPPASVRSTASSPVVSSPATSSPATAFPAAASPASAAPRIALPSASLPPSAGAAVVAAPAPSPSARREPAADTNAGPAPPAASSTAAPIPGGAAGDPRAARAPATREADAPLGALYSSSDAGVVPPVIRRQHLPSNLLEPSAEVPDDWPYLELLIDARGAVEQVRLHARQLAPGQTLYRHRMLLAAAKAWQFEPARRNGLAVRYLMRVPLEP